MYRKHTRRVLTIVIMVLLLGITASVFGAGVRETLPKESAISVVDSRGATISLAAAPQRIVSLSPNITEILFALGVGDRVVGRSSYCDYPQETLSITTVGDLFTPSIEAIVSLEPDLVIISTHGQKDTVETIEQFSIPVAYIDEPGTMEGTYRIITAVGALTGASEKASQVIQEMQQTIARVLHESKDMVKPSVYYVAGFGEWGDFTATGDTFIHDIITYAGGNNIAKDARNWSYQLEMIVAHDPYYIILPPVWGSTFEETKREFSQHTSYRPLTAVQEGRIITIESNMLERQGPRSAQAVEQLFTLLHKGN